MMANETYRAEARGRLLAAESELHRLAEETSLPHDVVTGAQAVAANALKAYLAAEGQEIPGSDDLSELVLLCQLTDPDFAQLAYATEVFEEPAEGYDGRACFLRSEDDAAEALEVAAGICRFVRDRI